MVQWGWLAQLEHIQLLRRSDAEPAPAPASESIKFFVTEFRNYLQSEPSFVVAGGSINGQPEGAFNSGITASQAMTHFLEALKVFALRNLRRIRTVDAWPGHGQIQGYGSESQIVSDCNTLAALLYVKQADGGLKMVHWGWMAQLKHTELLHQNCNPDADPELGTSPDVFFVTGFRDCLETQLPSFVVAGDVDSTSPTSATITAPQAMTHFLEAIKAFALDHMRGVYTPLDMGVKEKHVRWVLLVPHSWEPWTRRKFKACARRAGFAAHHHIKLLKDNRASSDIAFDCYHSDENLRARDPYAWTWQETIHVVDVREVANISTGTRYSDVTGAISTHTETATKTISCGNDRLNQEFVRFLSTRFSNFGEMMKSRPVPPEVTSIMAQWELIKRRFDPQQASCIDGPMILKLDIPERVYMSAAWKSSECLPPGHHASHGNELVLSRQDLFSIFDPVCRELADHIIRTTAGMPPSDRRVYLLGHPSFLPYLAALLQQVTVLPNPGSALTCAGVNSRPPDGVPVLCVKLVCICCLPLVFILPFVFIPYILIIDPILKKFKQDRRANSGSM